jgi:hypothetical protein
MGDTARDIFGQKSEMVGEIRSVDTRSREIEIRTDDRRSESVRYDNQTRVVYRNREYSVANLERGDYVAMRVKTDPSGYSYTDHILVRESVQERGSDRGGRIERLEGTVEHIDPRRGEFEVRDEYGRRVTVTLPYNPRRSDMDRLQSLRHGDRVRVEGQFLNRDRFELDAFV